MLWVLFNNRKVSSTYFRFVSTSFAMMIIDVLFVLDCVWCVVVLCLMYFFIICMFFGMLVCKLFVVKILICFLFSLSCFCVLSVFLALCFKVLIMVLSVCVCVVCLFLMWFDCIFYVCCVWNFVRKFVMCVVLLCDVCVDFYIGRVVGWEEFKIELYDGCDVLFIVWCDVWFLN